MHPQSRGTLRPSPMTSKSSPNLTSVNSAPQCDWRAPVGSRDERPGETSRYTETPVIGFFDDDDEDTEEDEDGEELTYTYRGSHLQATRSHPHPPPSSSQLFPPFYNRPPTPLPPSPSLTSLLRPSFSTHTSHHTTPESSDTESAVGAPSTAFAKSAATSAAAPRAHPNVPTYEYYGFGLYLASSAFFLVYILWAYLPSPFLHQLGIHYYPNRWWALAIPCWLVVLVIYIYIALASYNTGYLTLKLNSCENIVDEAAQIAVLDGEGRILRQKKASRFEVRRHGKGKHSRQNSQQGNAGGRYVPAKLPRDLDWRRLWSEGTDAVMDVPVGGVCEILYGRGRVVQDKAA